MERITVADLEVHAHIGVTDEERKTRQKLLLTMEMTPRSAYPMSDRIQDTVDYSAVRSGVLALVEDARWSLIETVAGKIAEYLLDNHPVAEAVVTVKKFPWPDAACVSCSCSRPRAIQGSDQGAYQ